VPRTEYADQLEAVNVRAKAKGLSVRDIADGYPGDGDAARRESCRLDLRQFLEVYAAAAFPLAWSPDHLRAIERIQRAVLGGGRFALAMPRGSGKTTILEWAAVWALVYGHRRFVVLVAATEDKATDLLNGIKSSLQFNTTMAQDFPNVCYPIARLENDARKAKGQLFEQIPTGVVWADNEVRFPCLPAGTVGGPDVCGSVILTGALGAATIRGPKRPLRSGGIIRPDFVIVDDPQTRESAKSPTQCKDRLDAIQGDVLGMAGPATSISAVAAVTVIYEGDLADRLVDPKQFPAWDGQRASAVYTWPTDRALWDQYHELRDTGDEAAANEFYATHRSEMDAGARLGWEARTEGCTSGVQWAENKRHDDADAFAAEMQNQPLRSMEGGDAVALTAAALGERPSGIKRGVICRSADYVTAFIDVHDHVLYWTVCAWTQRFDGWIVDYGAWPRQSRRRFTVYSPPRPLGTAYPGTTVDGAIAAGLAELIEHLAGNDWPDEDGSTRNTDRLLIDCGYKAPVVFGAVKRAKLKGVILPSQGVGSRDTGNALSQRKRAGVRSGDYWEVTRSVAHGAQYLRFDGNWWKSRTRDRLITPVGQRGGLLLFDAKAIEHGTYIEHLLSERAAPVVFRDQKAELWKQRLQTENHWWDCLVGCAVAASYCGCSLQEKTVKRVTVRMSDLQARKRR
jgi:hypothetical protein